MARYTGAASFPDGDLRYFVYDGTVDAVRRKLYASQNEADSAWSELVVNDRSCVAHDDVEVKVMPYYCHGDAKVAFVSMASSDRCRLTGPRSLNEAMKLG